MTRAMYLATGLLCLSAALFIGLRGSRMFVLSIPWVGFALLSFAAAHGIARQPDPWAIIMTLGGGTQALAVIFAGNRLGAWMGLMRAAIAVLTLSSLVLVLRVRQTLVADRGIWSRLMEESPNRAAVHNRLLRIACAAGTLVLLIVAVQPLLNHWAARAEEQDREQRKAELVREFADAWNSGDAARVAEFYPERDRKYEIASLEGYLEDRGYRSWPKVEPERQEWGFGAAKLYYRPIADPGQKPILLAEWENWGGHWVLRAIRLREGPEGPDAVEPR